MCGCCSRVSESIIVYSALDAKHNNIAEREPSSRGILSAKNWPAI